MEIKVLSLPIFRHRRGGRREPSRDRDRNRVGESRTAQRMHSPPQQEQLKDDNGVGAKREEVPEAVAEEAEKIRRAIEVRRPSFLSFSLQKFFKTHLIKFYLEEENRNHICCFSVKTHRGRSLSFNIFDLLGCT